MGTDWPVDVVDVRNLTELIWMEQVYLIVGYDVICCAIVCYAIAIVHLEEEGRVFI